MGGARACVPWTNSRSSLTRAPYSTIPVFQNSIIPAYSTVRMLISFDSLFLPGADIRAPGEPDIAAKPYACSTDMVK
ncbi:MAG: hypothetical protein WCJ02_06215 [bacterium]